LEGPEEAARILTDEVGPIVSQFSPSYSLAVNLVARGRGRLNVANTLVKKSFAMWEKRQLEERIDEAKMVHGEKIDEAIELGAQERVLGSLRNHISATIDSGKADTTYERVFDVLANRDLMKQASKSFVGMRQMLTLENNTLQYLRQQADVTNIIETDTDISGLQELFEEDRKDIDSEIETQGNRVLTCERDISSHVMSDMTNIANSFLNGKSPEAEELRASLVIARKGAADIIDPSSPATPDELTRFAKAFVTAKRQRRRLKNAKDDIGIDNASLVAHLNDATMVDGDDSWKDMRSLINVLQSYGCLLPAGDDPEIEEYAISIAGENVGLLGLENSLWCLVAVGGAWDILWDSAGVDKFRSAMRDFENIEGIDQLSSDQFFDDDNESSTVGMRSADAGDDTLRPQQEAATLVSLLRSLEPCELAGYVSCLVANSSRGGSGTSVLSAFHKLSPTLQEVIQSSNLALERFVEVQDKHSVDLYTSKAQLELNWCEVVTAWASGCTWNEAIELSGFGPGDLIRALNRALDALRQLGNLPINPARSMGDSVLKETPGIHPDIRRLCKEAVNAMDRYPVKDDLPFLDVDESDVESIENDTDDSDVTLESDVIVVEEPI